MRLVFTLRFGLIFLRCTAQELSPLAGSNQSQTTDLATYDLDEQKLTRFKKQAIQSISVSAGWMADVDGGKLSSSHLDLSIGSGISLGTRTSSLNDELSLRDFRITLGIEKLLDGGGGWFAESGYAFNRRLEYENDESEVQLGNGIVLRAGWRY